MRSLRREMMWVGVLLAALLSGGWPPTAVAQVTTTMVADTVYLANGTPASGTVLVSWPAFTTASGASVPSGSTSAAIGSGGALSVALAANAGATPMGTYYTVVYHLSDGSVSHEYWVVPVSGGAVTLAAVRNTVLPTSVAMQTVSKAYVDTAIAEAVSGHPLDSSPYVLKAGDTMSGPLVLPADPTASLQAADKRYVDTNVASVAAGLNGKVAQLPAATQVVTQPSGTQLEVNLLNGEQYASQYLTGNGNNGIANAVGSADCGSGCTVVVEQTYPGSDSYSSATLPSQGHVIDLRGGARKETFANPLNQVNTTPATAQTNAGAVVDVASTRPVAGSSSGGPVGLENSVAMAVTHTGYAGGSNLFPQSIESGVPYFKTTYSAMQVSGNYYTVGQHVLLAKTTHCYAVGDCLIGSQFLTADGGLRDEADEGVHPYDMEVQEDTNVVEGTCATGCTPGSTSVKLTVTSGATTEGEGRYVIDLNPGNIVSSGTLVGGSDAAPHPVVNFSGTSFPVSVFLQTAQKATSQSNNIAPGTVTLAIATSGAPAGFATNTSAAPAGSGVACVADEIGPGGSNPSNYEMANYTVIDGTHIQLTLNKAHQVGATIAMGGMCGYGLEQKVDTVNGIRQVFPVVGANSATSLYYAPSKTPIVGRQGLTSAFANVNLTITSAARASGVVTLTISGSFPVDVNGLTMTVGGVTDSSYNGSFVVTTTAGNTLTYAQAGANSSSSGGTVSMVTGGYALYPMAEVLGVFDSATRSVDGLMTLAPNNVAWATGDAVEEPHFYQLKVSPDIEDVGQTTPRPLLGTAGGINYQKNVGPGLIGWRIENDAPATSYYGSGGTHTAPDFAYQSRGIWKTTLDAQAGEQSVFNVHCNSHGCGRWNSSYNLFQLDSSVGVDTVQYQPQTSTLSIAMRGGAYSFSPTGFSAGAISDSALTPGQLVKAGSGGTLTSAGTVSGAGAGITTGPTASVNNDLASFTGTSGQIADSTLAMMTTGSGSQLSTYLVVPGSTQSTYFGTVVQAQSALASNCYFNGTNWVYAATGFCSAFRLNSTGTPATRGFELILAPSGTGGTTVTGLDTTYAAFVGMPGASNPQFMFNPGTNTPTTGTNTVLAVNPVRTVDNLANVQITTNAATNKALVLQGTAAQSANLLEVQSSSGAVLASVDASGNTRTPQVIGSSGTPTIANGSGAGSSPGTPTVSGNNMAGVITVTTGTSTTGGATLATVTFNGTLGTAPQGCAVMARNANAAAASASIYTTAPSTSSWTVSVGAAALTAATTYQWSYHCL